MPAAAVPATPALALPAAPALPVPAAPAFAVPAPELSQLEAPRPALAPPELGSSNPSLLGEEHALTLATNATHFPSGLATRAGPRWRSSPGTRAGAPAESGFQAYSLPPALKRSRPSSVQRGWTACMPGGLTRTGSPPDAGTTITALLSVLSASVREVTAKATRFPSGEIATPPMVLRR